MGTVLSLLLARLLSSVTVGVSINDPATFVVAIIVFVCLSMAASYVPAFRATEIETSDALRVD